MKLFVLGGAIGSYIGEVFNRQVMMLPLSNEKKVCANSIKWNSNRRRKGNIHKIESPHVTDDAIEAVKSVNLMPLLLR